MSAVKATAGLAMSTFKDNDENVDPELRADIDDDDRVLSNWKPSPDLKRMWMVPANKSEAT